MLTAHQRENCLSIDEANTRRVTARSGRPSVSRRCLRRTWSPCRGYRASIQRRGLRDANKFDTPSCASKRLCLNGFERYRRCGGVGSFRGRCNALKQPGESIVCNTRADQRKWFTASEALSAVSRMMMRLLLIDLMRCRATVAIPG
jgi:hypothetical protein